LDWVANSKKVRKLLLRNGGPLNENEIVEGIAGTTTGILAGEVRLALLCDEFLEQVEEGVYALRRESVEGKSVSRWWTAFARLLKT